jgi:hypothetical protein
MSYHNPIMGMLRQAHDVGAAPLTNKGVEGDCSCLPLVCCIQACEGDDLPHLLDLIVVPAQKESCRST